MPFDDSHARLGGAWIAAIVALLLFVAALLGFGAASPAFEPLRHPVALLGGQGEPNAAPFNATGFLLPGALLAWAALRLRARVEGAGWKLRIGLTLALLSALAFAAQGMLPLDPTNLLAPASKRHAAAWSLWWIAFVPGALLMAFGRDGPRLASLVAALLVPAFALLGPALLPAAIAQRIAFVLWFGWWIVAASRIRPVAAARS